MLRKPTTHNPIVATVPNPKSRAATDTGSGNNGTAVQIAHAINTIFRIRSSPRFNQSPATSGSR